MHRCCGPHLQLPQGPGSVPQGLRVAAWREGHRHLRCPRCVSAIVATGLCVAGLCPQQVDRGRHGTRARHPAGLSTPSFSQALPPQAWVTGGHTPSKRAGTGWSQQGRSGRPSLPAPARGRTGLRCPHRVLHSAGLGLLAGAAAPSRARRPSQGPGEARPLRGGAGRRALWPASQAAGTAGPRRQMGGALPGPLQAPSRMGLTGNH